MLKKLILAFSTLFLLTGYVVANDTKAPDTTTEKTEVTAEATTETEAPAENTETTKTAK